MKETRPSGRRPVKSALKVAPEGLRGVNSFDSRNVRALTWRSWVVEAERGSRIRGSGLFST